MNWNKRPKYGNKKYEFKGEVLDSKLERDRYIFLLEAERDGKIGYLRRQVEYTLIPKQTGFKMVHLKTKDKIVEYEIEKPVHYKADFVYNLPDGTEVIEDTKGFRTKDYIIKRKLMRYQGHPIREVKKATEEI